jgi:hypothetical protein
MIASEQWMNSTIKIPYFEANFLGLFLGYRHTIFRYLLGCLGVRHGDGLAEQVNFY